MRPTTDPILKIKSNVVVTDNGCWEWQMFKDSKLGYGRLRYGGRVWLIHVLAYTLLKKKPEEGMYVLHTCDNPACCNPEHLFEGTKGENNYDRWVKGRCARGETITNSSLKEQDVLDLRKRYSEGETNFSALARLYGVRSKTISDAIRRKTWTHI